MARNPQKRRQRVDENVGQLGAGGGGASEATSGGGSAAGIPEPETVERAGEAVIRGDVEKDRKKIFPEQKKRRK